MRRAGAVLSRLGVRRVLAWPGFDGWDILAEKGLAPVDPQPLCRAKAPELALARVEQLPLRRRCVALRGERGREAWPLASVLCPQVGTLLLDFRYGQEELARRLRMACGVAALTLGQGPPPQASVELSPCGEPVGRPVRLWGKPELGGLALAAERPLPEGPEPLALLTLLWETGRLRLEDIKVLRGE